MPHHYWGDNTFDWASLFKAEIEIRKIVKIARVGVHSKEKYGTLRWSFYLFDGSLHSLTHPGYVYSQYPKWLWKLNCNYSLPDFIVRFVQFFQVEVIKFAFHKVCTKYPHIVAEIIEDAPEQLLPINLGMLNRSMWYTSCKYCSELVRSDIIVCNYCNGSLI